MTPNKLVFKLYNTQDIYHVARNFCGSLFSHIGDFFFVLRNYSLRQKQLGHLSQTLFFPFSCSPRPSQSCLSRFGHQILYTNIEGTRRPQSVPTILTETVFLRNFRYVTPRWLQWREIARQVYARFGAIFSGKTLEISRIEREKTINRGKKSLFL